MIRNERILSDSQVLVVGRRDVFRRLLAAADNA